MSPPEAFDTSPESAREQREVVARLSGAEGLRIALELSQMTRDLALAGLKRRRNGSDQPDLVTGLIAMCYGPDALGDATR
jgi:hypothetical protein